MADEPHEVAPIYYEPYVDCKNPNSNLGFAQMTLPIPRMPLVAEFDPYGESDPAETGEGPGRWPGDTWQGTIACPLCGYTALYGYASVHWRQVARNDLGIYGSDTTCFAVEHGCATKGCEALVRFHTVLGGEVQSETDVLDRAHSGFFLARCAAGHEQLPIPRDRYTVTRVLGPIPSEA